MRRLMLRLLEPLVIEILRRQRVEATACPRGQRCPLNMAVSPYLLRNVDFVGRLNRCGSGDCYYGHENRGRYHDGYSYRHEPPRPSDAGNSFNAKYFGGGGRPERR